MILKESLDTWISSKYCNDNPFNGYYIMNNIISWTLALVGMRKDDEFHFIDNRHVSINIIGVNKLDPKLTIESFHNFIHDEVINIDKYISEVISCEIQDDYLMLYFADNSQYIFKSISYSYSNSNIEIIYRDIQSFLNH